MTKRHRPSVLYEVPNYLTSDLFAPTKLKSSAQTKSQSCYIPERRVSLEANGQRVS